MYQYTGTTPGEAYHKGTFSGRLERVSAPKGTGNGGETNATFTADTEGSSAAVEYRIIPQEQTVCVRGIATFTAEKKFDEATGWMPQDSYWTVLGNTSTNTASSTNILMNTSGVYDIVAKNSTNCVLSDTARLTVVEVDIVVDLEDQDVNGVRSGLNQDSLNFRLNGSTIPASSLTLEPTTVTVDGEQITTKLKVSYVPSCDELNLSGSNTVTVDIDDMVDNHMDQITTSFQLP